MQVVWWEEKVENYVLECSAVCKWQISNAKNISQYVHHLIYLHL